MMNNKSHCYISSLILPLFCLSALQNIVFKHVQFLSSPFSTTFSDPCKRKERYVENKFFHSAIT
jgi:hypothetical protein